ncbi:hypothetical protein GJ496_007832 [Pomphorhynchus laevis]|nr:hypothetical protein GJ496_007832 [Pomphorhynchus laevis]
MTRRAQRHTEASVSISHSFDHKARSTLRRTFAQDKDQVIISYTATDLAATKQVINKSLDLYAVTSYGFFKEAV